MKKIRIVLLALVSLMFIGCSAKSVVAPNTKKIDISTYKPAEGNGVLYLVRDDSFVGGAVTSTFYIDDKKIGSLGSESVYFIVELEPGTYQYKRVFGDMFGGDQVTRRIRVGEGFKHMFVVRGMYGFESSYREELIKNHRFLGYQKISK